MNKPAKPIRIIVVGGGITGLSAAHRLIELSEEHSIPLELVLLEADSRVGGVIRTIQHKDFLIEAGPDSFLTEKPWAISLCKRLDLLEEIQKTNPTNRRVLVARGRRLIPAPAGFQMLAPTKLPTLLSSPLFSWRGKLRIAMEPYIAQRKGGGDESLASFVTRRFGHEMLDRLVQPLVGEVYSADPEVLSMPAALSRFVDMESKHGSLIKALRRETKKSSNDDSGARYSLFSTFKDGMQTLVNALEAKIGPQRIQLGAPVSRVARAKSGGKNNGDWDVELKNGKTTHGDGVLIACPTYRAADMLKRSDYELGELLQAVPHASVAIVHFAFHREQVQHPLDAFGFVVPHSERRSVFACTFSNVKYTGRAPQDFVLLRAFLGGALDEDIIKRNDDALRAKARWDLETMLGIYGKPRFETINRYPRAMAQYVVGHLRRTSSIRQSLARKTGLEVAGCGFEGVGIPECVRDGERAAERLLTTLYKQRKENGETE